MTLGSFFVLPVVNSTELSMTQFSLIIAVFQLMWGISQPLSGALADRFGAFKVLAGGTVLLIAACLMVPQMPTYWGLILSIGLLLAFGTGSGGFSIIMGQVAAKTPPHRRGLASGLVNAGGSAGQFFVRAVGSRFDCPAPRRLGGDILCLGSHCHLDFADFLVASRRQTCFSHRPYRQRRPNPEAGRLQGFRQPQLYLAAFGFLYLRFSHRLFGYPPTDRNFTLRPPATVASTSIAIIGLANIAGCIFSGWCTGRFLGKYVLFGLYASRVAMILIYLAAPKTDLNFYLFAAGLGFTWLATVAPTAAITGKLFGTRYLATLFGLTMLSHQIGGFLGSYIGGIVITRFNDYGWMWYADAVLAGAAALLNLLIHERKAAAT